MALSLTYHKSIIDLFNFSSQPKFKFLKVSLTLGSIINLNTFEFFLVLNYFFNIFELFRCMNIKNKF
jgi:hypothetical protein